MTKRLYYEFFYYHSIPEMMLWGVLLVGAWTALAIYFTRRHPRLWKNMNRVVLGIVVIFILYWTVGRRGSGERELSLIPFYSFVAAQTSSERYRSLVANLLLFIPVGLCAPFSLCRSHWVYTTHPRQVSIGDGPQVSSGADGRVYTGREAHLSRSQPLNDSTGHLPPVSSSPVLDDSTAQVEHGTDNSRAVETDSSRDLETSEHRETRHPVLTTIIFAAILSLLIELAQWKWGLGLAETDDVIMNTLGASFGSVSYIASIRAYKLLGRYFGLHAVSRSRGLHLHKDEQMRTAAVENEDNDE